MSDSTPEAWLKLDISTIDLLQILTDLTGVCTRLAVSNSATLRGDEMAAAKGNEQALEELEKVANQIKRLLATAKPVPSRGG